MDNHKINMIFFRRELGDKRIYSKSTEYSVSLRKFDKYSKLNYISNIIPTEQEQFLEISFF